jgi:hypothetical protein
VAKNQERVSETMRERLVGYLMDALDDGERREVEAALADAEAGPALARDLEALRRAVAPLAADRDPLPAPPGLAERTLAFVAAHAAAASPGKAAARPRPAEPVVERRGLPWLDRAIMAATALAACILVAPLLYDAIDQSRARRSERNMQRISAAVQGYAEAKGFYPTPPSAGPLSRAGLYAPTLVSDERLVAADGTVLCPGSALARRGDFRVPSLEELRAAVGKPEFEKLVGEMGGDYGYTLGHRDAAGRLHPIRNRRRVHFPLMADAPDQTREWSDNHACRTHHVLFEDGHVERRRPSSLHGVDHIYLNRRGQVAAGVDPEDAVIGESSDVP